MFGFDFMLDHDLSPKLLEVNINPAMFLDTKTLEDMLPSLVKDACQLAVGIHEPFQTSSSAEKISTLMTTTTLPYDILHSEWFLITIKIKMDIDYSQDSSDEGDLYASFVNTQKQ